MKVTLFIFASLLFSVSPSHADDAYCANNPASKERVEKLHGEIDSMKAQLRANRTESEWKEFKAKYDGLQSEVALVIEACEQEDLAARYSGNEPKTSD